MWMTHIEVSPNYLVQKKTRKQNLHAGAGLFIKTGSKIAKHLFSWKTSLFFCKWNWPWERVKSKNTSPQELLISWTPRHQELILPKLHRVVLSALVDEHNIPNRVGAACSGRPMWVFHWPTPTPVEQVRRWPIYVLLMTRTCFWVWSNKTIWKQQLIRNKTAEKKWRHNKIFAFQFSWSVDSALIVLSL